jgi:hypothetical protein
MGVLWSTEPRRDFRFSQIEGVSLGDTLTSGFS